jgi:hypothetical protein
MSLADEAKIPSLGSQSLEEVSKFLKLVVSPASNADMESMKCSMKHETRLSEDGLIIVFDGFLFR